MNVIVDLNTPIKDGTEVVFRSPVDCSQVNGLKVYYLGGSQEFAFADAHGNNVGDIDHLFAENVAVKVILDVTHGMAFVQNADTNAYLEGRFNDIIDKLCPSFEKSGTLVQCEPVDGYPLSVSAKEDGHVEGVTVTVCGKNLYNLVDFPITAGKYIVAAGGTTASTGYACVEGFIPVTHLRGKKITLNHPPTETDGSAPRMVFYTEASAEAEYVISEGKTNSHTTTVPNNANYMRFSVPKKYADGTQIQIEVGDTVTAYEPYLRKIFKASGDAASEFIPVTGVVGRAGLMTVYAENDKGVTEVKVSGKADPVAIIEKLTNSVISLGGKV